MRQLVDPLREKELASIIGFLFYKEPNHGGQTLRGIVPSGVRHASFVAAAARAVRRPLGDDDLPLVFPSQSSGELVVRSGPLAQKPGSPADLPVAAESPPRHG